MKKNKKMHRRGPTSEPTPGPHIPLPPETTRSGGGTQGQGPGGC